MKDVFILAVATMATAACGDGSSPPLNQLLNSDYRQQCNEAYAKLSAGAYAGLAHYECLENQDFGGTCDPGIFDDCLAQFDAPPYSLCPFSGGELNEKVEFKCDIEVEKFLSCEIAYFEQFTAYKALTCPDGLPDFSLLPLPKQCAEICVESPDPGNECGLLCPIRWRFRTP
jgi:hypothetical protein